MAGINLTNDLASKYALATYFVNLIFTGKITIAVGNFWQLRLC